MSLVRVLAFPSRSFPLRADLFAQLTSTLSTSGALIYHFRRIFHDWADSASISILHNTALAMTVRSRILIIDTIVPDVGASRHVTLQDINMMSFGGIERTKSQWEGLLEGAGLRLRRIWSAEGNLMGAVEAIL